MTTQFIPTASGAQVSLTTATPADLQWAWNYAYQTAHALEMSGSDPATVAAAKQYIQMQTDIGAEMQRRNIMPLTVAIATQPLADAGTAVSKAVGNIAFSFGSGAVLAIIGLAIVAWFVYGNKK